MNKPKIRIKKIDELWYAEHVDDKEMMRLFGTTIVPTPFGSSVSKEEVIRRIQKLNPDKIVI